MLNENFKTTNSQEKQSYFIYDVSETKKYFFYLIILANRIKYPELYTGIVLYLNFSYLHKFLLFLDIQAFYIIELMHLTIKTAVFNS